MTQERTMRLGIRREEAHVERVDWPRTTSQRRCTKLTYVAIAFLRFLLFLVALFLLELTAALCTLQVATLRRQRGNGVQGSQKK